MQRLERRPTSVDGLIVVDEPKTELTSDPLDLAELPQIERDRRTDHREADGTEFPYLCGERVVLRVLWIPPFSNPLVAERIRVVFVGRIPALGSGWRFGLRCPFQVLPGVVDRLVDEAAYFFPEILGEFVQLFDDPDPGIALEVLGNCCTRTQAIDAAARDDEDSIFGYEPPMAPDKLAGSIALVSLVAHVSRLRLGAKLQEWRPIVWV